MSKFILSTPKKVIKKSKLKTLLVICTCLLVIGFSVIPSSALGRGPQSILTAFDRTVTLQSGNFADYYNLTTQGVAYGAYWKPNTSAWTFVDWTSSSLTPTFTYDTVTTGNKYYCFAVNFNQSNSSSFYRASYYIDDMKPSTSGVVTFKVDFTASGQMALFGTFRAYFGLYAARSDLSNFNTIYGDITLNRNNMSPSLPLPLGLNEGVLFPFYSNDVNTAYGPYNEETAKEVYSLTNSIKVSRNITDTYSTSFSLTNLNATLENFQAWKSKNNLTYAHLYPVIIIDFYPNNTAGAFYSVSNFNFTCQYTYNRLEVEAILDNQLSYNSSKPFYGSSYDYNSLVPSLNIFGGNVNIHSFMPSPYWFTQFWNTCYLCVPIAILCLVLPFTLVLKALLK